MINASDLRLIKSIDHVYAHKSQAIHQWSHRKGSDGEAEVGSCLQGK